MGAVHATTQAAALGMRHVLVPAPAPGFSALGLLTADHVVDAARTLLAVADADIDALNALADDLGTRPRNSTPRACPPSACASNGC